MSVSPCRVHSVVDGERIYCEQGPDGHYGTHCGSRSQDDYDRLRDAGTWCDAAWSSPDERPEPDESSRSPIEAELDVYRAALQRIAVADSGHWGWIAHEALQQGRAL